MGFALHLLLGVTLAVVIMRGLGTGVLPSSLHSASSLLSNTSAVSKGGCGAYNARNIHESSSSITAELVFVGEPCDTAGFDFSGPNGVIRSLALEVVFEEDTRLHITITDASAPRYQVPSSVLPRPGSSSSGSSARSFSSETRVASASSIFKIAFTTSNEPFGFTITHKASSTPLFTTTDHPFLFTPQHWRLTTSLSPSSNIYGLGEHSETLRLPIPENGTFTRTLWSRDSFAIPRGTNLYGNHPVYFDHRAIGDASSCSPSNVAGECKTHTHGVFLLNSNGIDVHLSSSPQEGKTLQYNVIGGIIDLYIFASKDGSPVGAAREYAKIVGSPAEVPYWSLGFHQCRYNYKDFVELAEVVANYSEAGIPLETMWTDIDYMDRRRIFTADPMYFPVHRMRELVDYLHSHGQKYVMMVDPAVGYYNTTPTGYDTLDRGTAMDVWLKNGDGSPHLGVVWPGVTVYPDWFHPSMTTFWNGEFERFFNAETGIDIDGVWIDMNEPASFCDYPCNDPWAKAEERQFPPKRTTPPPDPNTPIFGIPPRQLQQPHAERDGEGDNGRRGVYFDVQIPLADQVKEEFDRHVDPLHLDDWAKIPVTPSNLTEEQMNNPPYNIGNAAGVLGDRTAHVTAIHQNGLREYDTHNLFGTMMSVATRNAMLARRPGLKPLIITRSTFSGAGKHVGKWLGDNLSTWDHYRSSIAGMLAFASLYQVPMVGSDICGFGGNTTETLCARWAMLGAFNPFYRNHNIETGIPQEFYRWPLVAEAAKKAIDMRYRLLDYIYTSFHHAHLDGTPVLNPLWFKYPADPKTWDNDLQFLYGDSILVSPVPEEGETSVDIYLPKGIFYDFNTYVRIHSQGATHTLAHVSYTDIPVHIVGGAIVPLRAKSGNTTTQVRQEAFELMIAPDETGRASGSLYIDDGLTLEPNRSTLLDMVYTSDGAADTTKSRDNDTSGTGSVARLTISGRFDYDPAPNVARIIVLDWPSSGGGTINSARSVQARVPSLGVMVAGRELRTDGLRVAVDELRHVLMVDLNLDLSEPITITLS